MYARYLGARGLLVSAVISTGFFLISRSYAVIRIFERCCEGEAFYDTTTRNQCLTLEFTSHAETLKNSSFK